MKFGRMTDNDIEKNTLNFGHDSEEILQFQEHNLLVIWPLDDASASFGRTFACERDNIVLDVSIEQEMSWHRTAYRSSSA